MAASTLRIVSLAYGLFCFVALGVRAIWEGYVAKRPDRLFWKSVEKGMDTETEEREEDSTIV